MSLNISDAKKELSGICRRVHEKGFVAAYDGNLSLRLDKDTLLITPSYRPKCEITAEDLLITDYNGNLLERNGKVSTEVKIHLLAYKTRPDVNSVIHCHPVYATAFAAAGMGITQPVFPEVILTLGEIPLCSYGTPSTEELTDSMKPFISSHDVMLLENHGAVALGAELMDAYYKMEKLEHIAQTLLAARILGGARELSAENLEKLKVIKELRSKS